jgi:hypothetical protein
VLSDSLARITPGARRMRFSNEKRAHHWQCGWRGCATELNYWSFQAGKRLFARKPQCVTDYEKQSLVDTGGKARLCFRDNYTHLSIHSHWLLGMSV